MSITRTKVYAVRGGSCRRAASAGGAQRWGRGCYFFAAIVAICPIAPLPAAAEAAELRVPSGQPVYLLEYIDETTTPNAILRARFMAPQLGDPVASFETVLQDMEYLCNTHAIPMAAGTALEPRRIVVSLSAEPIELGVIAPDIPQIFEVYSIRNERCMWEIF